MLLSARHIEHLYGGRRVLAVDEIEFASGTITALVGPNGSGKSTLLRILGFLEPPTRGTLALDGKQVRTRADRLSARRTVTLVEQQPFLFGGTVKSNLMFGLRTRGCRGREATARVTEALQTVAIEELADRDARSLSDGEKQKAAVARALVVQPRVLLLDEPASAADRASKNRLYQVLDDVRQAGLAVCFASHHLEDAYRWSDRMVSLEGGRASPVTPENLFRVDIPPGTGAKPVRVGNLVIRIVTDTSGPATIALPPDDFIVSKSAFPSSARNQFPGRIQRISEDTRGRVTLTVDAGPEFIVRITPDSLAELGLVVGSAVVLSVKAVAVRVF